MTPQGEVRLGDFRFSLSLNSGTADWKAAAQPEKASTDRLTIDTRLAAIA